MLANLEGNIVKYCVFKIFTKRVFLPLIAIFLIDYGHVTLVEIALIYSLTALVQIVLEVPTGYVADKWGHKRAIVFGTFLTSISVLPYIFITGFTGGLIASVLFFCGGSFMSGAMQAFMHETLFALKREGEYSLIMGRAQSYGLLGNVLLIALVPLTYKIDPRAPFVLGFICLAISCAIAATLVSPPKRISVLEKKGASHFLENLKSLGGDRNTLFLMFFVWLLFGVVSASFDSAPMFREVLFKSIGIPVEYFGFILAIGSLVAAIVGRHISLLKKLSPSSFYMFDILYLGVACVLVGVTKNPIVTVCAFILFPAYDRTRDIIFESHVFEEFPQSTYKATLISALSFSSLLNALWAPFLLAFMINKTTLGTGQVLFGISIVLMMIPVFVGYRVFAKRRAGARLESIKIR